MRRCALLMLFAVLFANSTLAFDCADLASSKAADLVEFLQTQAVNSDPDCVSRAIVRLGDFRAASGSEVLVELLDFQRPESALEKAHLFDMHDKYPAISALSSIGMPAVPTLVAKLQSGHMTEVARLNGIHAVALIYRENPPQAIRVFMKAAANAKSQDDAARLDACAKDAVGFCNKNWHDRCQAALKPN